MKKQNKTGSIGVVGATAIGVGGMMGAGLYTLLGLAANSAGVWLPVSFLIGGIVAAFSVYSYSKLGMKYPDRGGAAKRIRRWPASWWDERLPVYRLDYHHGVICDRICGICLPTIGKIKLRLTR